MKQKELPLNQTPLMSQEEFLESDLFLARNFLKIFGVDKDQVLNLINEAKANFREKPKSILLPHPKMKLFGCDVIIKPYNEKEEEVLEVSSESKEEYFGRP